MTERPLEELAKEVGEVKEEQEEDDVAQEGEEFSLKEYNIDVQKNYDGGWTSSH